MQKIFTNKETKHEIKKPEDWTNNGKNNFTPILRSEDARAWHVKDSWNEDTQAWDIDLESQARYINRQTLIQWFKTSPLNNKTPTELDKFIDDIDSMPKIRIVLKEMLRYQKGMLELMKHVIKE